MKRGNLLFNVPAQMKQGARERVQVRLARDPNGDLAVGLTSRGTPEQHVIPVGPFMSVRLTGDGFEIKPLTAERQFVEEQGHTEWSFDVTPNRSGTLSLQLIVGVRLKLPRGDEEKYYPVMERSIRVAVNPVFSTTRFISANWQWLASALVLPFAGWWLARRRERRNLSTAADASRIHRPPPDFQP